MLTGFFTPNVIGIIVASGRGAMIIGIAKIVYTILSSKHRKNVCITKRILNHEHNKPAFHHYFTNMLQYAFYCIIHR